MKARLLLAALWSLAFPASGGGVLTLEEAYDRALSSDQSILKAYWETRIDNLAPYSALTRLGPSLTGNLSQATSRSTTTFAVTQTTQTTQISAASSTAATTETLLPGTTVTNTGSGGLTFQQTLLDLTAIPAYRAGKLTAAAAKLDYQYTIRTVLYGVAQAYYEVLKQQRVASVYKEAVHLAEQQLDLAQKKANAGESLRSDVMNARFTVESDRQGLIAAENTLESDRAKLANALNLKIGSDFQLVEPPQYSAPVPSFEAALSAALRKREDLRSKELAIDENIQNRKEIVAEYLPKLVAQADSDFNSVTGSSGSHTGSWDATISLEMPFLSGGQREIDLRQTRYQINQARLDYQTQAKTVAQDVKDACLTVSTLKASLESLRVQTEAAEQASGDTQNEYRAGSATSVDVLTALNNLNAALRDLATATYDYQVALRNLETVGGIFQEERIQKLKFK